MPEQDVFPIQHLWLLAAAVWIIFTRLPFFRFPLSSRDGQKRNDPLKIVGGFAAVFCITLWFIQLASGLPSDPFFWNWEAPQRWVALMVVVCFWVSICWWGFLRGGIQMIADTYSLNLTVVRVAWAAFAIFSLVNTVSVYIVPGGVLGYIVPGGVSGRF